MPECQKRRLASQEYTCAACGTRWDVNDPEPPPCKAEAPPIADTSTGARSLCRCGGPVVPGEALCGPCLWAAGDAAVALIATPGRETLPKFKQALAAARRLPSLVDRIAELCEHMRAGRVTLADAADTLEDLAVEVGVMSGERDRLRSSIAGNNVTPLRGS